VHVARLFDLAGKTALVTGGGRGIGRHLAVGLAEAGADVAVASRKLANCEKVAREVDQLGRRGLAVAADLAQQPDIEMLADRVIAEFGRLDVLVNNAGVIWGAPTLEYPVEGWDKVFAVNVRGLWLLSQRVAVHMKESGGGSIIHISSISGFRGAEEEAEPAIAYGRVTGSA
jgi:gluconate 5-dehydrogenase